MTQDESLNAVKSALENVLARELDNVTRDTVSHDIVGWDSLANVKLFIEMEMSLGVRFNVAEIEDLPNVGALADLIASKLDS